MSAQTEAVTYMLCCAGRGDMTRPVNMTHFTRSRAPAHSAHWGGTVWIDSSTTRCVSGINGLQVGDVTIYSLTSVDIITLQKFIFIYATP